MGPLGLTVEDLDAIAEDFVSAAHEGQHKDWPGLSLNHAGTPVDFPIQFGVVDKFAGVMGFTHLECDCISQVGAFVMLLVDSCWMLLAQICFTQLWVLKITFAIDIYI